MMGLIADAVAVAMRAETGIARAQRAAAEGWAIADAAINLTVARLLAADATRRPWLNGTLFGLVFDGQAVLQQTPGRGREARPEHGQGVGAAALPRGGAGG